MRVTYANCFLGGEGGDVLLTDEPGVAAAGGFGKARITDVAISPERAQEANLRLWRLGFEWFRENDHDPTVVEGVSAGDLAATEAIITVLLPAARAVLGVRATLEGSGVESFESVVAEGGPGNYDRVEEICCRAAEATARALLGEKPAYRRRVSRDPRNSQLFGKYARSRDPNWLAPPTRRSAVVAGAVLRIADRVAALHRRRGRRLVVLGYNPTRAFIDRYREEPERDLTLAVYRPSSHDVRRSLRTGDRLVTPTSPPRTGTGPSVMLPRPSRGTFEFEGVDLTPVVEPHLRAMVQRYADFAARGSRRLRMEFERLGAAAVLVPFDGPPEARLLVRVAQGMGIPSLVLNNGFMGDDFQAECMTADFGLAWSEALAQRYFSRRPMGNVRVTGNPKGDQPVAPVARSPAAIRRILVGGLSFSPADINCRRSDPERFLEQVLEGIELSDLGATPEVVVKLHPADSIRQYDRVLERFPGLAPRIVLDGDVVSMFEWAHVYVTTFSTSLMEAAAKRLPVLYYRVNEQRLHPPFGGDVWLERRTASTPGEFALLLAKMSAGHLDDTDGDPLEWAERYLGPRDGRSVERVAEAVRCAIADRAERRASR